jgi:hypothetical protein
MNPEGSSLTQWSRGLLEKLVTASSGHYPEPIQYNPNVSELIFLF